MTAQHVTLGRAFLFSWRRLRRRVGTRAQLTIVYGILAAIAATTALVAVNLAVRLVPDPLLTGGTGRLLDALMIVSAVALVTLIAGTSLVTWTITGGVLRPLNDLNAAATRAAQGPPAGRLEVREPAKVSSRDELAALAGSFNRMLARLDHQLEARRRFTAIAATELPTQLATTRQLLDAAADDWLITARTQRLIEQLSYANQRSLDLVDGLMALSRSGTVQPMITAHNLDDIIVESAVALEPLRQHHQVKIIFDIDDARAATDRTILRGIVDQLLDNAIRYNRRHGTVWVGTSRGWGRPTITISNTGEVMSQREVEHALNPTPETRTGAAAHGFGLAITQNLARSLDATLTVRADSGGGVTAQLALPAAEQTAGTATSGPVELRPTGRRPGDPAHHPAVVSH
ncbi:sensor histidine kinase [Microlunatus parietis]|uniref:histidine kinase n=1 Tax=Microlunatus parietis TaxID=682979 RepID=A0A7Y9LBQ1_9ACTN|nr:HAMP domain-containing sensor histidine kinase [Microlunatus parietis]NYE71972.1 two-component system sensor histidine kinase VanS [Microlunatus parietis]